MTGQGGAPAGTGASNIGVEVQGGTITAGGLGTVTVNGTGGATSGNSNIGVLVNFPSTSTITSSGGNVSVTATGGGTGVSSPQMFGVAVDQVNDLSGRQRHGHDRGHPWRCWWHRKQ